MTKPKPGGVPPRIYYNLGLIYQFLNNNRKAEASLLKANSISPNQFDVLYALADLYIKKGDLKNALRYANEMKEKFPENATANQLVEYINNL